MDERTAAEKSIDRDRDRLVTAPELTPDMEAVGPLGLAGAATGI